MNARSIAMVAIGLSSAPVLAQHTNAPPGGMTLAAWSARMQSELDHAMERESRRSRLNAPSGVVRVKFNCSESGAPDKITLERSSGYGELDRMALRAVKRVVSLHPLPDGLGHNQKYAALLMYESTTAGYESRLKKMKQEVQKANDWYGKRVVANEMPHDAAAMP